MLAQIWADGEDVQGAWDRAVETWEELCLEALKMVGGSQPGFGMELGVQDPLRLGLLSGQQGAEELCPKAAAVGQCGMASLLAAPGPRNPVFRRWEPRGRFLSPCSVRRGVLHLLHLIS